MNLIGRVMKPSAVLPKAFFLCGLIFAATASADTVIMKDKTRIKGLILDEFKDRIVISTAGGERTLMKDNIRSAVYDDEERALIQIGRTQFKKGNYVKAYYTYEKAAEINPDSEEACQKRDFLRNYLETKMRYDVADSVKRNQEIFGGSNGDSFLNAVKRELGLTLVSDGKYVFVEKITPVEAKASRKFRQGDRIVSVWGEMTAYRSPEEVAEMVLRPGQAKVVIERVMFPLLATLRGLDAFWPFSNYNKIAGADLKLNTKGIVIDRVTPDGSFGKSGIRNGDMLFRIGGENTRYMPMEKAVRKIRDDQGRKLEIVIHREITIWKKD